MYVSVNGFSIIYCIIHRRRTVAYYRATRYMDRASDQQFEEQTARSCERDSH